MRRHTVGEVMTTEVVTARRATGFKEIVEAFGRHAISAVPVIDDDGRVLGIVTESDLIRKLGDVGEGREYADAGKAGAVDAGGLMSAPAITIAAQDSLAAAARTLETEQLRRLPVVDEAGHLVGILSARDLLRPYLRDDEAIAKEIRDEVLVRTLWIDPARVAIRVADGIVTLDGTLDRRSTVGLVVHLVESVAGVVDVVSHLTFHFDDETGRVRTRSIPLPM